MQGKKSPKITGDAEVLEAQSSNTSLPSKTSMNFVQSTNGHCAVNNLSSPESAYSTGYSTDGTSPGASIPPEYYINIRTGTHYFHSNPASTAAGSSQNTNTNKHPSKNCVSETTSTSKVGSLNPPPSVSITVLSPRPGRHKREDEAKKTVRQYCEVLPESSTEEDIAERLGKVSICPHHQMAAPKVGNKHKAINVNVTAENNSFPIQSLTLITFSSFSAQSFVFGS